MNRKDSTTVHAFARQTRSNQRSVRSLGAPSLPRIVAIGGGTGLPVVLRGLVKALGQDEPLGDHLTALVTVSDDGGSSGVLRQQLDMLPPGDIRNCLVALAADDSHLSSLLQHRFEGHSPLEGHAVGNLLLAALVQQTGSFLEAVERLGEILGLRGRVLPVTESKVHLRAELESGEIIDGETSIVSAPSPIRRIGFDRPVRPMPDAIRALVNSDIIVVGPGSLYTSILPNLLVTGVASTISGLNATRIYVANLMTQPGETDAYSLEDHLRAISEHTNAQLFDYVLVNNAVIPADALAEYASQRSEPVLRQEGSRSVEGAVVVERDFVSTSNGLLRHSPDALAASIIDIWEAGRRQRPSVGA
ncbi:MAG TPA: uridine diphosphate-N-acetylglucosamine-binding protein YvcK [Vicinamibacterales bacterium]|nr:uridine diphosphate-N-acetylglucosamine-binding protein YvcK [Vicinamibacterales bacterium]